MKIMITGGLGFIGSHLAGDLLKDSNNDLVLLTKTKSKIKNIEKISSRVKIEEIDVTNFDALGSCINKYTPDVIFHLAGETSHSRSFENPLYDIEINTTSTLFILEQIRKLPNRCRFILGSTFIVVGKPKKLPINEKAPCNPTTLYGANRLTSEHYCKIYHSVYDLDTVIFRITNSFGPREQIIPNKNAINFLIYKAYKGEEITIYNHGKFFRDLVYVSDVISGIETIMKEGKSGELYWISSAKKTWFYQLGKWLKDLSCSTVNYVNAPEYTKKVDVGNFLVDNSKLRKLGWKPRTPIKEGIKLTMNYFEEMKL